jgi:hypothetical protein
VDVICKYVIVEEDSNKYKDMEKQGEALDVIMLIMEDNQLLHICRCEMAAEAVRIWSGEGVYQKLSWTAKIYGLRGEGQRASKREDCTGRDLVKERRD